MCENELVRLSRRKAILAGLIPFVPRAAFADDASLDLDAAANTSARWLAGMAAGDSVSGGAEWTAYAKLEDERWQASQPRLRAMNDWAARELDPHLGPELSLFYPFAGPDALHAIALFGGARGARRVILVGLEPVGRLPDPQRGAPAAFFPRLGAALADIHRLTFFRTHEMSSDFQQDGVLPALVACVARMGGRVTRVRTAPAPASPTSAAGLPGASARIDWTTASGQPRRFDYFQADLANAGLAAYPELSREVHALAPYVTFVKAAMYLLAEPRFSRLRQMILDDSALVLQDDTGVPFRHFDDRWAFRFFGRYETPGTPFEDRFQRDLEGAFERRRPSPLPFGIGYHVDPRRSNLLLASKGR